MDRVNICNVEIDNLTMIEAIDKIEELVRENNKAAVFTPNVDHVVKLQSDLEFKDIYKRSALILVDGVPLLWAGKYLGTPLKERICGADLFQLLCERAAEKGLKVFFNGGRPGAADAAAETLKKRYPGLQVVGTYCPPLGFDKNKEENDKLISAIKKADPDILFVGLGAPKQEKWIDANKDEYDVPVSLGIGVSFELVSGMVKRAPIWMQKAGLEWFWRILAEPKRMWKRYLVDDMVFFKYLYEQKKTLK